MSRDTAAESASAPCKGCGREMDDHQLVVNAGGVVTAGIWTDHEKVTCCADAALDVILRDLVIQIARLELEAHVRQAQLTTQSAQIQELVAENTALRAREASSTFAPLADFSIH